MSACSIKINQLLQKIRTLSKEGNLSSLTSKMVAHDHPRFQTILDEYLKALDELRIKFYEYHETVEQYKKLQEVLQKNEIEIRKHVGIEQQLKLYIDTLKAQYEESEADRLELLQNSKNMMKSLKGQNQRLYGKLKELESHKVLLLHKEKVGSKKIFTHERVKTDHFLSVYENQRTVTDHEFASPSRKKNNNQMIDMNDHQETSKKKRMMIDIRKKQLQNYTAMAYSNPQKKRNSKKKNSYKKIITNLSDTKKIGLTSGFKPTYRSNKKVHKSVFSLPDSQCEKNLSHREEFARQPESEHPSAFQFPSDLYQRKRL